MNPKGREALTKWELRQRLRTENVPEDCYSLDGGLPEERYCLAKSDSGWEVYKRIVDLETLYRKSL